MATVNSLIKCTVEKIKAAVSYENTLLDIVQSFPLLSYCIVSPIYISPICNVDIRIIFSMEKIKLVILYFSLFTWYQSQRENLILFSSDRVSFRSHSPPPDLLLAAAGDSPGSSSPAEKHRFRSARGRFTRRWQPRRKPASHAPSSAALLR